MFARVVLIPRTRLIVLFVAALLTPTAGAAEPQSHQANGVKIGEVSPTSAIIWTRVTQNPTWNTTGTEYTGKAKPEVPEDKDVPTLRHAAPGMPGKVRVRYVPTADKSNTIETNWFEVSADADYTHHFHLTDLKPATEYHFAVETAALDAGAPPHSPFTGSFKTAPAADADVPVRFLVMTCQAFHDVDNPDGFEIYKSMLTPKPDFIVPNGDIVYLDSDAPRARSVALARFHWNRMYGFSRLIEFHRQTPGFWTKDDHDTYDNDVWPQEASKNMKPLTYAQSLQISRDEVPHADKPYRTVRWGNNLQVWITEGREYRSPNTMPDGPEKTIWGAEQKRWFKESVAASDAPWKILVSPTPLVGPDRGNKHDNHANNNFQVEGNELRDFLREQGTERMFVICGDRHWQYHSVDPRTGVNEFSAGPASDEHASGSPGLDPEYHRFHRVKGGYLSVDVAPGGDKIAFKHHDVHGAVVYEKSFDEK